MSAESKRSEAELANLRRVILKVLDANKSKYALNVEGITNLVGYGSGFDDVITEEVKAELEYLAERGLVTAQAQAISGRKLWKISANGRDFLAGE